MKTFSFEVDTREYGFVDLEQATYSFRALCTSDDCRLASEKMSDRTDAGVVKRVSRGTSFCPACGYALFWEKRKK